MLIEVIYSDNIYYFLKNWFESGFVNYLVFKRLGIVINVLLINYIEMILGCMIDVFYINC